MALQEGRDLNVQLCVLVPLSPVGMSIEESVVHMVEIMSQDMVLWRCMQLVRV